MVAVRRRMAWLRAPQRAARLALGLWFAWAVIVWNVVLDHTIVVAARQFLYAAALADLGRGPVARMDDFMRPAVASGVRLASGWAALIAIAGVVAVRAAARASRPLTT